MTADSCHPEEVSIPNSTNPEYLYYFSEWEKFRYTMEGGDWYIEEYLKKFSERESLPDFKKRKCVTPVPAFATAALTDVKNAIFQRMSDIKRVGGSQSYQRVIRGEAGGIDLQSATMNHFIGTEVLNELIFIGKVGVYIDMPALTEPQTLAQDSQTHPYAYIYRAEQIRNWIYTPGQEGKQFDALLLEDVCQNAGVFGLPLANTRRFRLLTREDGVVRVRFFDENGDAIGIDGSPGEDSVIINIPVIPFVLFQVEQPLMRNIANHQIALLNLESSDISFTLRSNLPFYTEQKGPLQSTHIQGEENSSEGTEITAGGVDGRGYAPGMDRPGFINPSSEPLEASMAKQTNLKDDIRTLVNLSVSAIRPKFASAESKEMDEKGLESGLSFLGLVLAQGERQIAQAYNAYERGDTVATIHYPERYSLKSDQQRLAEAKAYTESMPSLPSVTYQKLIARQVASILLESKVSADELEAIIKEIMAAKWLTSDAEQIHGDVEKGLVDMKTAAEARGYDPEKVELAAREHSERLARISASQSSETPSQARGNPDGVEDADVEKDESQDADKQDDANKAVRGKA